uniref:Alpha-type protein kinase domain-containing protein n=1 Tax=Amphimedon queenslandica TaxID=400682 RepID=A0A1X7TM56_AMPQE
MYFYDPYCVATFEKDHFAEGRFRRAYRGQWTTPEKYGQKCVIKRMKSGYVWAANGWDNTIKIYNRARKIAYQFNRSLNPRYPIRFTGINKYVVSDSYPTEYVVAEDYLEGDF